ncbi:MAG: hypothetical protein AAGA69_05630 [Pseudomonadota bacterium]
MIGQKFLWVLIGFLAISLATPAAAQEETETPSTQAADPADVESIDAIMAAVYDVISGDAGVKRDWDRMRSLFVPDARLIPYSRNAPSGVLSMTVEDYIERSGPFLEGQGFHEIEIGREMHQYGNIVQAFSAYEARNSLDDPEPFMRGINSFQLVYAEDRWWVVTIFWQRETEDNPIPAEYLFETE